MADEANETSKTQKRKELEMIITETNDNNDYTTGEHNFLVNNGGQGTVLRGTSDELELYLARLNQATDCNDYYGYPTQEEEDGLLADELDNLDEHHLQATVQSDQCVEQLGNQWFVDTESSSIDVTTDELRYNNGELVYPASLHGPFGSEADALAWLADYNAADA